ncbi:hypothetical protein HOY82DRAFT_565445 [Tuber indicum]|nr:hypothetical protein HOY82DRAFT_565445 [Tuber indicum]
MRTSVPIVLLVPFGHTRSLTSAGQCRLNPTSASVRDQTGSVIADVATSHLADSPHGSRGGPLLHFSPIHKRQRSKHQFTTPLNPINNHMSGTDADAFLTEVMLALNVKCLSSPTKPRKWLGGDWALVGGGAEPVV